MARTDASQERHRLGIYCPGAGTGGPWRYVHSILAAIDPAEFDVTVFCNLPGAYEPIPWVKVVRLDAPRGGRPESSPGPTSVGIGAALRARVSPALPAPVKVWAGFAREANQLARRLRRHPLDLFHTQNTGREESPIAARLAGAGRVLGTFHVDSTYDLHGVRSGFPHRALEWLSNHSLHRAIAVSEATKADWVRRTGLGPGRVVTIPNGIDPEAFRRRRSRSEARRALDLPAEGRIVIGCVGRLDEAKGFAYLIDALARLAPNFPELLVIVAGDGPLRDSLRSQADARGIAGRVRFLGFQADVALVLEATDIFVLPSLCEAMPFALLEASALELPVIGTSVGGVPEVIGREETGLIVPPRDPAALEAALRHLLADPDRGRRLGAAGRRRVVRHFHVRDTVRRTLEVYRDMLRSGRVRRAQPS